MGLAAEMIGRQALLLAINPPNIQSTVKQVRNTWICALHNAGQRC